MASKNIFLIIYFIIYIMEIVYSPHLSPSEKSCIKGILEIFGRIGDKPYLDRNELPKLAFKDRVYDMLKYQGEAEPTVAQKLFNHFHDIIRPIEGTLTLRPWCEYFTKDCLKIGILLDVKSCVENLRIFFSDSDDPTKILKDAFLKLVAKKFNGLDGFPGHKYFYYLIDNTEKTNDFMTPKEICQGKKKADAWKRVSKKKRDGTDPNLLAASTSNQK